MTRATHDRTRPASAGGGWLLASTSNPAGRGTAPPRRRTDRGTGREATPVVARGPLRVEGQPGLAWHADPAVAIVHHSLADYRLGHADRASRIWHDDIAWKVAGLPPVGGEHVGAEEVFAYHRLLERLSRGTFRQDVVALEGSRGAIVNAYLRTTASRRGRRLEIPTLIVFELAGGRIRRVTELPGDRDAWERFWAD